MKKILVALPLVASASWAGTSYYAGTQTQDAYHKLLTQLNDYKPLVVDNASYTSGLSQSVAITNVRASTASDAKVLFQLHHSINHSPVGYDDNGVRVGAANIVTTVLTDNLSQEAQDILVQFDNGEPGRIVTDVDFTGAATSVVKLNPIQVSKDGSEFSYSGGEFTAVDNNGSLTATGNIGSLNATSEDGSVVSVNELLVDWNLQRIASGVYTGTSEFSTSSANFISPYMGEMSAGLLKVTSNTVLKGDSVSGDASFTVNALSVPVDLNSVKIDFSADGLSVAALTEYTDAANRMGVSTDWQPNDQQSVEDMLSALKNMVQPGLSIRYDVTASNSGGTAEIGAGVAAMSTIGNVMQKVSTQQDLTVRDLLDSLKINVDFRADAKALVQWQAEGMAQHFMLQPYMLHDGITYKSNIEVKDTLLTANGDAQSLETLLGPMLDQPLKYLMP